MRQTMSARWRAFAGLALAAAVAIAIAPAAIAQTDATARISGVARHSDGGALPGVNVEAEKDSTRFVVTAVSRGDGFYQLRQFTSGVCL